MKTRLPLLLLMFFAIQTFAQDEVIKDIRKKYKIIRENYTKYDSVSFEIEGESTEGAEGTAYSEDGSIKYMDITWFGESGRVQIQYYFHNQKLFFAFEQNFSYNRPVYWNAETAKASGDNEVHDPTKTKIEENRYYYNKGEIVRWLDPKKKKLDLKDEAIQKRAAEFLKDAYRYMAFALKAKK